jgi:hypothetical protein
MWFIKLVALVIVGAWGAIRGAEEAFTLWVKRAARARDLSGVSWA